MPSGGFANAEAKANSCGTRAVPKGRPVAGLMSIRWMRFPSRLV